MAFAPSQSPIQATEICTFIECRYDRTVVISCSGELDMLTSPMLARRIADAVDKQPSALIVDLTDVVFLASAGMQVLVQAHDDVGPAIEFVVVADGPFTHRPMTIVGVDEIFAMRATLDAALEYVSNDRHG